MQYLLTIYNDKAVYDEGTGAAMGAIIEKHMAFGCEIGSAILNEAGLQPLATRRSTQRPAPRRRYD